MDFREQYFAVTDELREVQQSRSAFQLAHFVVARHGRVEDGAGPRQRLQALIELRQICINLRTLQIEMERARRALQRLEGADCGSDDPDLDHELHLIRMEDMEISYAATLREYEVLASILEHLPRYSREEHDAHELQYWEQRLARQLVQNQIALNHGLDRGDVEAVHEAMREPPIPVGCIEISLPAPEDYLLPQEEHNGTN